MQAIKVAPNRPVHFTGFFTLGADKPFIMVENLDTYDEIVKLLRGRKHAKLFGTKVGGVIFGGGCKASVSHALDDYLPRLAIALTTSTTWAISTARARASSSRLAMPMWLRFACIPACIALCSPSISVA